MAKTYDITPDTPMGTYIRAKLGERFTIRMPEVHGRIIEPALGKHTHVDHECRSEGHGYVEFDMIARERACDLVEFPLIEDDWDGECDADPEKADPYLQILVVVAQFRRRSHARRP
jgi:hypothetical protein